MKLEHDLWHLAFANLVQDRAPPNFEVQSEVRLTLEPQRADLLLLRRLDAPREDDKARVLRTLWSRLGKVSVLEYKSPVDSSFRPGDLLRLHAYGSLYASAHFGDLSSRRELTLVLVVPSITPTLAADIAWMGGTMVSLGGGYGRIDGVVYTLYVALTDEVSKAEKDQFLALFSHHKGKPGEAMRWLQQWMKDTRMKQTNVEEMAGYDEMFQKLVEGLPVERRVAGLTVQERLAGLAAEERLAGLAPEERLAGLAPEERLAGLAPEERLAGLAAEERLAGLAPEERLAGLDRDHQALALPVEVLRVLPETYIDSLSAEVRDEVRRRIQRAGH